MAKEIVIKTISSEKEQDNRNTLVNLLKESPVPDNEKLFNTGLFLRRQELSRILFMNHIYQQILYKQGIIIEFGVRWGQNLVTLSNLRGIYEPYSYGRRIVGFDTFEGFANVNELDGNHSIIKNGSFSVTENYEAHLLSVLQCHQNEAPLNHINKIFLRKGDAVIEFEKYLKEHPETIVAFAYFDFDIYQPTKKCLELLLPNMPKGSIIGFDELLDPQFPGETIALKEIMDIRNCTIHKNPFGGLQSYIVLQ